MQSRSPDSRPESQFGLGHRVHSSTDSRRVGTVKYVGSLEGYSGTWVGVDWDNGEGKHDGSINGVQYFQARSERSGSFVRTQNLSLGISLLQALELRYKAESTQEEEDEMYVLSARNKRVLVQLVGKEKIQDQVSRFEELKSVSISYMGVNGDPCDVGSIVPTLKELDLTGNLISEWKDVGTICEQLPALATLNLSSNLMSQNISRLPQLKNIRILVLNSTGIHWAQVEILKHLLPAVEELHLMGNDIGTIELNPQSTAHGFDSLRLLNLENNCIAEWNEILKISHLRSLEKLHLNNNNLKDIWYPVNKVICELLSGSEYHETSFKPFHNLQSLLVGSNNIEEVASIDSLNSFPKLVDIRLSENPIADPGRGGLPRFVLVARLAKVEMLNGSMVSSRERKESEIRYVRLVMSKFHDSPQEMKKLHPRFAELKSFHGIEDERPSTGTAGPQKMASGLLSITLKCVGPSIGEKPLLTKKLPATTTVGKLKILCESFFKLKSMKPKLFLQEEGSALPILLDGGMETLIDLGIGNESTILVAEEC